MPKTSIILPHFTVLCESSLTSYVLFVSHDRLRTHYLSLSACKRQMEQQRRFRDVEVRNRNYMINNIFRTLQGPIKNIIIIPFNVYNYSYSVFHQPSSVLFYFQQCIHVPMSSRIRRFQILVQQRNEAFCIFRAATVCRQQNMYAGHFFKDASNRNDGHIYRRFNLLLFHTTSGVARNMQRVWFQV